MLASKLERAIIAAVLVALTLAGAFTFYTNNTSTIGSMSNDQHALHIELYIYKNNKLIYYDRDDPATQNFLHIIKRYLSNGASLTALGGTQYGPGGGQAWVAVVTQDVQYNYNMYSLNGAEIKTAGTTIQEGTKYIIVSGSIIINSNATIYGVALGTKDQYNHYFLLFYDHLNDTISVSANDVVTVVYKIVVP